MVGWDVVISFVEEEEEGKENLNEIRAGSDMSLEQGVSNVAGSADVERDQRVDHLVRVLGRKREREKRGLDENQWFVEYQEPKYTIPY